MLSVKNGFTLVEIMVVVAIFAVLFPAVLGVLTNSQQSWRLSQDKLAEQQEARRAMDSITRILKQSNPVWDVDGVNYPVTISEGKTRIDFYQPIFDGLGNIATLKKITYKLNPDNPQQLLRKEGTQVAQVAADYLSSLSFGGGCAGCLSFNCLTVASDCPMVDISLITSKKTDFTLASQVTLRNQNIALVNNVTMDEPEEGEF